MSQRQPCHGDAAQLRQEGARRHGRAHAGPGPRAVGDDAGGLALVIRAPEVAHEAGQRGRQGVVVLSGDHNIAVCCLDGGGHLVHPRLLYVSLPKVFSV